MTAHAKVEQRHRDDGNDLLHDIGRYADATLEDANAVYQALANAEQRGREDAVAVVASALAAARGGQTGNPNPVTREMFGCVVAALEEVAAAIRARGQRKEVTP